MARYGDLDAVKLKVQRHLIPNTDDDGTVDSADAERWFLRLIDEEPTVDVVPKSEVDKTIAEFAHLHADALNKFENARAEVAREIFEEIEKILSSYKILPIPPMDFQIISLTDLAALKKKYTEGEE